MRYSAVIFLLSSVGSHSLALVNTLPSTEESIIKASRTNLLQAAREF